jgi:hypothetical protein
LFENKIPAMNPRGRQQEEKGQSRWSVIRTSISIAQHYDGRKHVIQPQIQPGQNLLHCLQSYALLTIF